MRRPPTGLWLRSAIAISALALLLAACKPSVTDDASRFAGPEPSHSATSTGPSRLVATVTAVIDGDTIEVEVDGAIRVVRLLMIEAPDPANGGCFGNAATAFVFAIAPPGTRLLLEPDTTDADPDGSLPRYAYLADGSMLNEQLLRGGFARFAPLEPDTKYLERLRATSVAARDQPAGLWAECRDPEPPSEASDVRGTATANPTLAPAPAPTELAGPLPTPTATTTATPDRTSTATPTRSPTPPPTATPSPTATAPPAPTARPSETADSRTGCDPSYPTICLPPPPPDLDCGDIPYRRFQVLAPDPHRFDRDKDGIGCES